MTTPSQAPLSVPDRDRAIHALERAAICAERGVADRPVVLVEAADLAALSAADLRSLLDRAIVGQYADEALDSLLATGVLDALLPEIKALVGFGDGEWRHKDVWKHTKQVVAQSVPRLEVRWGALFHDIGKVKTRSISPDGEVHFFGHAEVGARMFDKLERRSKLFGHEASLRDEVRFLVLHHLRASQYDGKWTDSAVRRFAREIGPSLDNLLCLSRADITTKRPEKKRRGINMINGLAQRIAELAELDAKQPPLPTGLGTELMSAFGIPPSKKLGDIKRALELAVEAGEIAERLEAGAYVQFIAERKERFGLA
ncbi:MAG: HD domain-containing protein [Myxococcales bacterium]|nr:MAG: HD domain-containing protein [Myxococcales bacterium]